MRIPDFESKLLIDIHDKLVPWPEEWQKLEKHLRDRAEMVSAGILRCPGWFSDELRRIDWRLRAWWDAWRSSWVIDRLQDEGIVERMARVAREDGDAARAETLRESASGLLENGPYYLTILQFQPTAELQLDRKLLDMLRECDMQRFESPGEYVAKKRAEAEAVQKANDERSTDTVLAAVDRMSTRQIENFIAVEEAMRTGETIVAHGSDERFLEHAAAETERALARGEKPGHTGPAINPGMHPRIYRQEDR